MVALTWAGGAAPRRRAPHPQPGHRRAVDGLAGPGGRRGPRRGPRRRRRPSRATAGGASVRSGSAPRAPTRSTSGSTAGSFADLSMDAMRWIDPVAPAGSAAGAEPSRARASSAATRGRQGAGGATTPAAPTSRPTPTASASPSCTTRSTRTTTRSHRPPGSSPASTSTTRGSLGWCDIAYNFFVDRFGRTWQGRSGDLGVPIIGGHSKGFNTGSVGVAFLGPVPAGRLAGGGQPDPGRAHRALRAAGVEVQHPRREPPGEGDRRERREHEVPRGRLGDDPDDHRAREREPDVVPGRQPRRPRAGGPDGGRLPQGRVGDARALDALRQPAGERGGSSTATCSAATPPTPRRRGGRAACSATATRPSPLTTNLLQSPEANRRTWSVPRLYFAYFLRRPDHGGLTLLVGPAARRHGEPRCHLAAPSRRRRSSSRSTATSSDEGFVRRVYRNVLGREPDPDGLDVLARPARAGRPATAGR